MKHLFCVESEQELAKYCAFADMAMPRLEAYAEYIANAFEVRELPRAVIWTSLDAATHLISDIPVPAYTNDFRVVIAPELDVWRQIYLKQLDGVQISEDNANIVNAVTDYYRNELSDNYVLQILGHELAHHSDLFLDDFNSPLSDGIWFEEGMVEYISRKYFLTEGEFAAEVENNRRIVSLLEGRYGAHSLEEFGASTYDGDYASIFFEYWRSFLAVNAIVQRHCGDVRSVFESYHEWNRSNSGMTLLKWFGLE